MVSGFRFRKSWQLLPGVRLNVSKKGASVSIGPSDVHITTGTSGTYFYLDLPGSGAYYRKKLDTKSDNKKSGGDSQSDETEDKLDLGFWDRLTIPGDELALVEALKALASGDETRALEQAQQAVHLGDGAFLAGFLLFKRGQFSEAAVAFQQALKAADQLGNHAKKYDLDLAIAFPITDTISIHIQPSMEGALLALAECHQQLGLTELATENMQELYDLQPGDLLVRLALAEVLSEAYPDSQPVQQRIVALAEDVHNASPIHAALMYYRARALRKLGLIEGAKDTLTKGLRRKKDYPDDLLRALRYERAVIYEMSGDTKKAQTEYQKIYAEAPTYEDVAARLGL